MSADVNVTRMVGDVSITDRVEFGCAVQPLGRNLTLNAAADSDTKLEGVTGPISVTGFESQGDFGI